MAHTEQKPELHKWIEHFLSTDAKTIDFDFPVSAGKWRGETIPVVIYPVTLTRSEALDELKTGAIAKAIQFGYKGKSGT